MTAHDDAMPNDLSDAEAFDPYWDYDEEEEGNSCELCGLPMDFNSSGECSRCTGLDRCCDDLCYAAGRCMHR